MKPVQLSLCVRHRDDATFGNFHPGGNARALHYVQQLCGPQTGWTEGLIYLWGQSGVGRSHLLQAACVQMQEQGELAMYVPLAEVVAYGPRILDELERSELVCLDDLETVVGKPVWEEALFHLFNRLRDSGRRLLVAAAMPPRELPLQLMDLRSRLSLALIFQLQPLTDQGKLQALQLRAAQRGLQLPDDVGHYILSHGARGMGALFELLDQLDQASLQAKRRLTIPFLKQTLGW